MSRLDTAWDHFQQVQKHLRELESYFDETLQVGDTMDIRELGRWKLLFKEAREFFKAKKGRLGGLQQKLDRVLVAKMVEHGLTEMDVDGVRLYADMRGFFNVKPGFEDEAPMVRVPAKDVVQEQCEKALREGKPLPRWATEHSHPEVKTRQLKRG